MTITASSKKNLRQMAALLVDQASTPVSMRDLVAAVLGCACVIHMYALFSFGINRLFFFGFVLVYAQDA